MNEQTKKALENEEAVLLDLYNNSQIDAAVYYKGLVKLAAEHLSVDSLQPAINVLRRVSEEYLTGTLEVQMTEDQDFRQLAAALAEMLVEKNVVYLGEQFNFPGPAAKA